MVPCQIVFHGRDIGGRTDHDSAGSDDDLQTCSRGVSCRTTSGRGELDACGREREGRAGPVDLGDLQGGIRKGDMGEDEEKENVPSVW